MLIFETMQQQEITSRETCLEKITKKDRYCTHEEPLLFVNILIDEEFNFMYCLEKKALNRSTNEELYKEILQLFQGEMNTEEFLQCKAKILARRSTNLCKLIQRNFKQNTMLSNESGAKSKTDHEKAVA